MTLAIDRDSALKKAEKLLRQGRLDSAIAEYVRLVEDQPRDLTTANALGDLYVRAGQRESAVAQYLRIATHLEREGFLPKASALYKKILKIKPDDEDVLSRAAEIAARQGLLADAKAALTGLAARREARGDHHGVAAVRIRIGELDPNDLDGQLAAMQARAELGEPVDGERRLWLAGELAGRQRQDEALAVLQEAARLDPGHTGVRDALVRALVARGPADGAFEPIDALVDQAMAAGQWTTAREVVQTFLARVPRHVPALMKLVEICVDGGLDDEVSAAQAELVDAHLEAGSGTDARIIAEDLLAREPDNPAHRNRLRRALVLLGEPDPDQTMADRLETAPVFDAPDLDLEPAAPPEPTDDTIPEPIVEPGPDLPILETSALDLPAVEPARSSNWDEALPVGELADPLFQLSARAIDMTTLFEPGPARDEPAGREDGAADVIEIDLSDELSRLQIGPVADAAAGDLEGLFQALRDDARRGGTAGDAAEQSYQAAIEREAAGDDEDARRLLETAARSPVRRFEAGARLARLYVRREQWMQAVDWFERAAQAPAPTTEEGRALLYDLGRALEAGGESVRALAIYLELQADAGEYRDVADRIDRLSSPGMRG